MSLDGPYGDLSLRLTDYHTLFIIAGGIGITPFINLLEIVCTDRKNSNAKEVNLYWSYRGPELLQLFSEKLRRFLDNSSIDTESATGGLCPHNVLVNIHLYNTSRANAETISDASGFTMHTGRMDLEKIVKHEARVSSEKAALFVCGPAPMMRAVTAMAAAEGVEYHAEVFNY